MDELIPINVMLSGRSYRIRIRPDEEAAVRRSVKAADEKVNELRQLYAGKDDQDFLAMCLLMYATDTSAAGNGSDSSGISDLIAKIDKALAKKD